MVSRREMLIGGIMTAMQGTSGRNGVARAAAPQPRTKVNFDVPAGSCDCAVHVFGDPKRYPFWEGRTYTPETATAEELRRLLKTLGLDRVVIAQATVYGTDNSCVLDSVRAFGNQARGIVMIDEKTSEDSLNEMHRSGIRGIRLNLRNLGVTDPSAARRLLQSGIERVKNRNWLIQINTQPGTIEALRDDLMSLTIPVAIDHFGGASAPAGLQQPGFGALLDLVKAGKVYVKVSGAELVSARPDLLSDVAPFAKALLSANPQRLLWGTQWPHPTAQAVPGRKPTDLALHVPIDDGKMLNLLAEWVPDAATRRLILVENPARLYDF